MHSSLRRSLAVGTTAALTLTGLIASATDPVYGPMAAAMVAGMTPPLGIALATFIARNRFGQEERDAGKIGRAHV